MQYRQDLAMIARRLGCVNTCGRLYYFNGFFLLSVAHISKNQYLLLIDSPVQKHLPKKSIKMTEQFTKPAVEPTTVALLDKNLPTPVPRRSRSKLRQHAGEWVSAVLSLLLLILTIAYASRCIGVSRYQSIGSSRSRTILVLRVLSELTTTMLGLTLALTMERVQWHQILRERGQSFLSFLGLAPGTSILGLAQLLFVKGPCMASWRWWSLSRLTLIAILPILNVVIFGKSPVHNLTIGGALLTGGQATYKRVSHTALSSRRAALSTWAWASLTYQLP
jgi:hypothetical protein